MASLTQMQNKYRALKDSIAQIAGQAIEETKEYYIEANAEQLSVGEDREANPIKLNGNSEYSDSTVKKKLAYGVGLGRVVDHITLYDKGNLYNTGSWNLRVEGNNIYVDFDNIEYGGWVIARTTDIVLGLNDESRRQYINSFFYEAFFNIFYNELSRL